MQRLSAPFSQAILLHPCIAYSRRQWLLAARFGDPGNTRLRLVAQRRQAFPVVQIDRTRGGSRGSHRSRAQSYHALPLIAVQEVRRV